MLVITFKIINITIKNHKYSQININNYSAVSVLQLKKTPPVHKQTGEVLFPTKSFISACDFFFEREESHLDGSYHSENYAEIYFSDFY